MTTDSLDTKTREAMKEREDKACNKVSELRRHGLALRSHVEVTVFEGAEYDDSVGPGGNDPAGYFALTSERLTDKPGDRVSGYVTLLENEGFRVAQIHTKSRLGHGEVTYISGAAIHSFRLIPEQG